MSHPIDLPGLDPAAARSHLLEVVEAWKGVVDQDVLAIPSQSGLRRGVVRARVGIERLGAHGSRIELEPFGAEMHVHLPSALMLSAGAAGGIAMMLVPFLPALWPAIPLCFMVTIGAWFLVSSRLGEVGLAELATAVGRGAEAPAPVAEKPE